MSDHHRNPALLKTPGLGTEVVRRLRLLCPALPGRGYVAGQAVSSIIDQILGTGPCVVNDVDVFLSKEDYAAHTGGWLVGPERGRPGEEKELRGGIVRQRSVNPAITMRGEAVKRPEVDDDDGYGAFAPSLANHAEKVYDVQAVHRNGLLNLVAVSFPSKVPFSYGRTAATDAALFQLLRGFDMNAVRAAVNISTGKLVYSTEYEQFFQTRELRILLTLTPLQSLLRYLKKRRELNCYGNDEGHIRFTVNILSMCQFQEDWEARRREAFQQGARKVALTKGSRHELAYVLWNLGSARNDSALAIGSKFRLEYDRVKHRLDSYLDLDKHGKRNLWLPTPKPEAVADAKLGGYGLATEPVHQVKRFWQLHLPPSKTVALRRQRFQEFLVSLPDAEARKYQDELTCIGDEYLEGIENEKPMAELFEVVREHVEFADFSRHLSFLQMGQLVRIAKARMKRHDARNVWGVFRSVRRRLANQALQNPEVLDAAILKMKSRMGPLVSERLPLPAKMGNIVVRELTTGAELHAEGDRMSHCVGGYGPSVAERWCRIVSLKRGHDASPQESATAEWEWREVSPPKASNESAPAIGPLEVRRRQLYAWDNTTPLAEVAEAESKLRKQLNDWLAENVERGWILLCPERYEARLSQEAKRAKLAA